MALIPPPPIGEPPGSFAWQQWYLALQNTFDGTGTVPWNLIDTSGSELTDIASRAHNVLQSIQGGTTGEFYHLTQAEHASISGLAAVASGTYTPTLTNVANLGASTAYTCQYVRVGSTVSVSGKVDIDPTAAATTTQLGISLPVASNFSNEEDCAGTAYSPDFVEGAAIMADGANNRAQLEYISNDVSNHSMFFTFIYRVI